MEKQVSRRHKRYKAKRLYYTHKYTSQQICAMVGVTQATMSKWVQRYGWKNPENAGLRPKVDVLSGIINIDFCNHLTMYNPDFLHDLKIEIRKYMDSNKSITLKEVDRIKDLVKVTEINETELGWLIKQHTNSRTDKVSQLKQDEAKNLIEHLSLFDPDRVFEVTIKKVNP